ncbi:hypothetical protein SRHO_G00221690 [Serrasalmus rhombeus]
MRRQRAEHYGDPRRPAPLRLGLRRLRARQQERLSLVLPITSRLLEGNLGKLRFKCERVLKQEDEHRRAPEFRRISCGIAGACPVPSPPGPSALHGHDLLPSFLQYLCSTANPAQHRSTVACCCPTAY